MTNPIPDRVQVLLERYFTSVSQVEVLVLLVRERRPWRPDDIAVELGLNRDQVRAGLRSLVQARLAVRRGDLYELISPATSAGAAAEDLAKLYDRYRVRILNIIFAQPSGPVRDFADAFRLRPPPAEGDEEEDDG